MSVASRNPFALLDEDAPTSTPQKAAPAPAPAPTTKDAQKNRTTPASRGGKYYNRGGKANTVKDTNAAPADDPVEGQRKFDGPGRGGRGRGRGGRGGRGSGDRPPRGRQFDRHSGTGKVDTDKQTHQAWGGDDGNQERQVEEQAAKDASAEAATPTVEEPADGEAATQDRPARREREPEEDDNTLTLDQYLAQKKESDIVPKLSTTRRANEGVDEEAWKNTVQLTKNEEDEAYFIGKTKTTHKSRNKKEEKVYLEIDAHFDRPSRGGRGGPDRGGRGRGGRGGRGGNRGTSNGRNAATFDVGDESAFPSLT